MTDQPLATIIIYLTFFISRHGREPERERIMTRRRGDCGNSLRVSGSWESCRKVGTTNESSRNTTTRVSPDHNSGNEILSRLRMARSQQAQDVELTAPLGMICDDARSRWRSICGKEKRGIDQKKTGAMPISQAAQDGIRHIGTEAKGKGHS